MLLLESHEDQDDLVRPYLGYESNDYEETGHVLYGASVSKAYCQAPELRVVYRLVSASHCWLVGDDGPIPDRMPNALDRVTPTLGWNPQMGADCLEDCSR